MLTFSVARRLAWSGVLRSAVIMAVMSRDAGDGGGGEADNGCHPRARKSKCMPHQSHPFHTEITLTTLSPSPPPPAIHRPTHPIHPPSKPVVMGGHGRGLVV